MRKLGPEPDRALGSEEGVSVRGGLQQVNDTTIKEQHFASERWLGSQ